MPSPVLSPQLLETIEGLTQNLLASETFLHYRAAKNRLENDTVSQNLLKELSRVQAHVREAQDNGTVRQEEIETLRQIQTRVQENSTIMEYVAAQQGAVNLLREINDDISALLGVNFAVLAQKSTC
ncbi:MAG: hypothetical protein Fur0018_08590 [Anaerolineales bacterium]